MASRNPIERLCRFGSGHNGQCQIVAIAAFVVGLEGIGASDDGRAVGQIAKRPGDCRRRGIVNHSKTRPRWQDSRSKVGQLNRCSANLYPVGRHLIRGGCIAVDQKLVSGIAFELQFVLDR